MNYITPGMTPTFSRAKVKLTDVKDREGARATRQKTSIKLSRGRIYRKIPKISSGAYVFLRPFLRGLFLEGNLRFKIDSASLWLEGNLPFLLCLTLYLRALFPSTSPRGLTFGGAI